MSRRHKEHPAYDQHPDEKRGIVIASVLGVIFVAGIILIIRGLAG